MNIDDLYGTMYSPGDGTIDPSSWTASLSKGATMRGAKVINCVFFFVFFCINIIISNKRIIILKQMLIFYFLASSICWASKCVIYIRIQKFLKKTLHKYPFCQN